MLSTEIILLQVVVAYSKSLHCFSIEGGTELSLLWVHLEHLLRGSVSFSEFPGWELTMGIVEATLLSSGLLSLWTLGIECGAKFSFLWIHLENLLWGIITFGKLTRWEFTVSVIETSLLSSGLLTLWLWALSIEGGGKLSSLWVHLEYLFWGSISWCEHA